MPDNNDKLAVLDSEDRSVSVAEARHMARANMLIPAMEALFQLGMNPETKEAVRANCLQFVVNFASEAQGGGSKQITKLSPEAAKLIARLGRTNGKTEGSGGDTDGALKGLRRDVYQDAEAGQRLRSGPPDGEGRDDQAPAGGGLGPENHDGDEGAE